MKQTCLACARNALDKNLYCQDVLCPAERSPLVLESGERLEDIEIIRPLIVLRASTLYEARRDGAKLLLKVAHPGQRHTDRLKREAYLALELQRERAHDPALPLLLSPLRDYKVEQIPSQPGERGPLPYGRVTLRGRLLYFCLFAHFDGEPLRSVLKERPQLWTRQAAWITIRLAAALQHLHGRGRLHLALSPDVVLAQFDPRGDAVQVLLIDLGLACPYTDAASLLDYPDLVAPVRAAGQNLRHLGFVAPAYTAPELLGPPAGAPTQADLYGLGLTLYELLEGRPAFVSTLAGDAAVLAMVVRGDFPPMRRQNDIEPVVKIIKQALATDAASRQGSVQQIRETLTGYFGEPPPVRRRRLVRLDTGLAITVALLAIAFAIALAISFGDLADALGIAAGAAQESGCYV